MAKQVFFGFVVALAGSLIAVAIGAPIPWMLGSLIFTALFRINGANILCHASFRKVGQWIIGIALGLHFTPQTIEIIKNLLPYVIAGCVFALAIGIVGSAILYRLSGVDYATAYFSSTVGAASEMVVLAERNGSGNLSLVASSHSLRVLIIVILIPFSYQILGLKGDLIVQEQVINYSILGLIKLFALTGIVCFILDRIKIPNAMMLGGIVVTAFFTANEIVFSHLRPEIQQLGQLLLGWSLGSNYRPGFFRQAPRFLGAVTLMTVVYLLLAFVFCVIVAQRSDIYLPTAILAMSPGGIAEMAITAKVLMLGVPLVTSFQVSRLIFILLTVSPSYQLINRYLSKKGLISK
ncbi:MAG: AbrB family transcriptional regulator [Alcaligenaceae bacterium]|nr:AbrB family transcriptional regulator [Alcaligenaceae bacterium]NLJ51721.1 AbrB family transcriptional regulator [Alcaligenaceae bacterium]